MLESFSCSTQTWLSPSEYADPAPDDQGEEPPMSEDAKWEYLSKNKDNLAVLVLRLGVKELKNMKVNLEHTMVAGNDCLNTNRVALEIATSGYRQAARAKACLQSDVSKVNRAFELVRCC